MERQTFSTRILVACGAATILAGCNGTRSQGALPGILPQSSAIATPGESLGGTRYKVLYNFGGDSPTAPLTIFNGILYGTGYGGSKFCGYYAWSNCGTVFRITQSGKYKKLYKFDAQDCATGAYPNGLIHVNGALYGTTFGCNPGGTQGATVFKITTSGDWKLLYQFDNPAYGTNPAAGLVNLRGTLYGTASLGGLDCAGNNYAACGSVFKITTGGQTTVLYRFKGKTDGSQPASSLAVAGGSLYGTTIRGGDSACFYQGCGTVFKITRSDKESVLYRFKGGSDGAYSSGPLTDIGGTLYGMTSQGGDSTCACGTVFKISASGAEKVIYRFNGGEDGSGPTGGLTNVNGTLYGVTANGGSLSCYTWLHGCGTIFKVTQTGRETVLHRFQGATDGALPSAGLTLFQSRLYGSTSSGGVNYSGTIFFLTVGDR